jgi:hypothetical protein
VNFPSVPARRFRAELPGDLNSVASYTMSDSDQTMTAEYGFRIRTIDLRPGTALAPTSREDILGKELIPSQMILDGLRRPVGSLTFWFPEKLPDGSHSSFMVSVDPSRQIFFDPISRTVHLTMMSAGKPFQLERPLLVPRQGMHFVVATWDDLGDVHLYVDGSERPKQP